MKHQKINVYTGHILTESIHLTLHIIMLFLYLNIWHIPNNLLVVVPCCQFTNIYANNIYSKRIGGWEAEGIGFENQHIQRMSGVRIPLYPTLFDNLLESKKADSGAWTRCLGLGRTTLYQMSYIRMQIMEVLQYIPIFDVSSVVVQYYYNEYGHHTKSNHYSWILIPSKDHSMVRIFRWFISLDGLQQVFYLLIVDYLLTPL